LPTRAELPYARLPFERHIFRVTAAVVLMPEKKTVMSTSSSRLAVRT
jgi:hypothetical protein